ncbi:unnamed protein product, partial [Thlaspi arvense]
MANLLYLQLSSPSASRLAAGFRRRGCCMNCEIESIATRDSFECHASRGRFRFRDEGSISWMLAPIGISLLLGTDSNAGLMALAVPLVQSVLSLAFSKVLSRPNIRPMERSRRDSFSRTRKARQEENMGGGVDKGGYKSWMVGDTDSDSTGSSYGGWDDLDKRREFRNENPSNEDVRPRQQFKRQSSRRWRVKEKPLLLRMLIAAFPFLSSWTKLLY